MIQQQEVPGPGKSAYFYNNFAAPLYGYISRVIKDTALSQQLLKVSLEKIECDFWKYNKEKSSLLVWMLSIVRNIVIHHLPPLSLIIPVGASKIIHELYVIRKYTPEEIAVLLRLPAEEVWEKINKLMPAETLLP